MAEWLTGLKAIARDSFLNDRATRVVQLVTISKDILGVFGLPPVKSLSIRGCMPSIHPDTAMSQ